VKWTVKICKMSGNKAKRETGCKYWYLNGRRVEVVEGKWLSD
jgi:hypothetical protein